MTMMGIGRTPNFSREADLGIFHGRGAVGAEIVSPVARVMQALREGRGVSRVTQALRLGGVMALGLVASSCGGGGGGGVCGPEEVTRDGYDLSDGIDDERFNLCWDDTYHAAALVEVPHNPSSKGCGVDSLALRDMSFVVSCDGEMQEDTEFGLALCTSAQGPTEPDFEKVGIESLTLLGQELNPDGQPITEYEVQLNNCELEAEGPGGNPYLAICAPDREDLYLGTVEGGDEPGLDDLCYIDGERPPVLPVEDLCPGSDAFAVSFEGTLKMEGKGIL